MTFPHNEHGSEGVLETREEVEAMEQNKNEVEDNIRAIREKYNSALSISDSSTDKIGQSLKVIDLGDVQTELEDAMGQIGQMTATDGAFGRFATKILPAKWIKKAAGKKAAMGVEGSTVSDVSKKLINSLVDRRDEVENVFGKMESLHHDLVESYKALDVILEDIDKELAKPNLTQLQISKLNSTKTEIRLQKNNHHANIVSCAGSIKAAQESMTKLGELLPSIRSNVNNGLAILASIKKLSDLSDVTDMVVHICDTLRTENMQNMETELVRVIKQSSISKDQIKAIENSNNQCMKMQQNIQTALIEADKSRADALDKLEKISLNQADNLLGYEVTQNDND